MRSLTIKIISFLVLVFSSVLVNGQNKTFNLRLCEKTITDGALRDIIIIDSIRRDTINAQALLKGETMNIRWLETYVIVLAGKRKWDYCFVLLDKGRPYRNSLTVCFNSKALRTKKKIESDITVSDGSEVYGSWTRRISKKTYNRRKW